jgi:antitoxin ParD1/3/4
VDERVGSGHYANSRDFVRDVLRKEMERLGAIAELQRLFDEGIASGVSKLAPDEVFARARARARAAADRKTGSAR